MTLSGLQIFKLLPGGKKEANANCKECGFATCMAYAMKLAKGDASLDACSHISDELKEMLEAQSGKQQEEITFGCKSSPVKTGGENVVYRHDKTFINPTCLSIQINTSEGLDNCIKKVYQAANYTVERVGEEIELQSLTINNDSEDYVTFNNILESLKEEKTIDKVSLILVSSCIKDLLDGYTIIKERQKPILYLKSGIQDDYIRLYTETKCPVVVEATSVDELSNLVTELEKAGIKEIIMTLPEESEAQPIEDLTLIRRSTITNNVKTLRYPIITFASKFCNTDSSIEEGMIAGSLMAKYSNIIVLNNFNPAIVYSLFTLRQNLFTDPQKPLQMEPKIYTIGEPDKCSPVIVTTNFALTYFSVASEIEASNIPCYLLITPSDGMSVLTAWAANKFNGEIIAKAVKDFKLEETVDHKNLIISGYVSMLKEEIEDEMPGWTVDVAPSEAVDLPDFLKEYKPECKQLI